MNLMTATVRAVGKTKILWEEKNLNNIFHSQGKQLLLSSTFLRENSPISPPDSWHIGLDRRPILTKEDTLDEVVEYEPQSKDYSRATVGNNIEEATKETHQFTWSWQESEEDPSEPLEFTVAASARFFPNEDWGMVRNCFLTTAKEGTEGILVSTVHLESLNITPVPDTFTGSGADPSVTLGSLLVTPAFDSFAGSGVDPTPHLESLLVSPAFDSFQGSGVNSQATLESLALTIASDTFTGSGINPATTLESLSIAPTTDSFTGSGVDPSAKLESIAITPNVDTFNGSGIDPTVTISGGSSLDLTISPTPVSFTGSGIDPTVESPSLSLSPNPVSFQGSGVDPTTDVADQSVTRRDGGPDYRFVGTHYIVRDPEKKKEEPVRKKRVEVVTAAHDSIVPRETFSIEVVVDAVLQEFITGHDQSISEFTVPTELSDQIITTYISSASIELVEQQTAECLYGEDAYCATEVELPESQDSLSPSISTILKYETIDLQKGSIFLHESPNHETYLDVFHESSIDIKTKSQLTLEEELTEKDIFAIVSFLEEESYDE